MWAHTHTKVVCHCSCHVTSVSALEPGIHASCTRVTVRSQSSYIHQTDRTERHRAWTDPAQCARPTGKMIARSLCNGRVTLAPSPHPLRNLQPAFTPTTPNKPAPTPQFNFHVAGADWFNEGAHITHRATLQDEVTHNIYNWVNNRVYTPRSHPDIGPQDQFSLILNLTWCLTQLRLHSVSDHAESVSRASTSARSDEARTTIVTVAITGWCESVELFTIVYYDNCLHDCTSMIYRVSRDSIDITSFSCNFWIIKLNTLSCFKHKQSLKNYEMKI